MHKVFLPALPFAGACLAASPWLPGWASIWLATATTAELMSQQFHAWAHMKKSELPPAVIALQVRADERLQVYRFEPLGLASRACDSTLVAWKGVGAGDCRTRAVGPRARVLQGVGT